MFSGIQNKKDFNAASRSYFGVKFLCLLFVLANYPDPGSSLFVKVPVSGSLVIDGLKLDWRNINDTNLSLK